MKGGGVLMRVGWDVERGGSASADDWSWTYMGWVLGVGIGGVWGL